MALFWTATVVALLVTAAFVAEGVKEFRHLREGGAPEPADEVQAEDNLRFSLKALGGVVASFASIVLISVTPYAWYLLPALSIGSAVAVTVAFVVDRRARESRVSV